jgi:hypothetical protein
MSDKKAWEKQIDGALAAWPPVKAPDEAALAEKTLNRIRANFPPKSKLTLNDDALVGSPFPQTEEDDQSHDADATDHLAAAQDNQDEWEDVSQEEVVTGPTPMTAGPDATLETQVNPFADVTQEIRPDAQRTLREKSRPDFTRDEIRAATAAPDSQKNQPQENKLGSEKSSQIDVPIARASSIPPPSSGVARSSGKQVAATTAKPVAKATESTPSPTSQKKAEDRMGQVERQRDRTSFKDLAKLAATPPPSGTSPNSVRPASAKVPVATPSSSSGMKSDSGVVDLQAAALSDPQGAERAKSTPLASGSLFDEDGPTSGRASVSPPSTSGEHPSSGVLSAAHSVPQQIDPYSPASVRPSAPASAGRISVPVSAGPHSAVAAMQQPQKAENSGSQKKSRVGVILFSLVGVAAIAAAGVFYVHSHHVSAVTSAAPLAPVAANDTQPAATQPVAVAQADQPAAANSVSVDDPSLLAQNAANPGAKSAKPVFHSAPKSGKPSSALKDAMEKTEVDTPSAPPPVADTKATAAATPATKDEAPPPVGGSANLQNAMQTAAGPSDSTTTQAAATGPKFAPGSVPQRPSQGALSSAIGRSLPDARACLGPDDGVSYATVIFESGGGVQNVTLSGFASNKPAGACIITALKKATVGPFAEPTYTAKITVRP